ncbi:MAG TPA: mobile mystery protein B [Flavobacteriales bacterium]|nr:mobile mystery protein B [Flavobacteriales bacterium]
MGVNWEFTGGETRLDPDEITGLRIPLITTRAELDEHEQANIQHARVWLNKRKPKTSELLTESFVKRLHKEMYNEVWKWAGEFRTTEKNIGVDPVRIATDLRQLLDDARYWVEHATYGPDEIAVRVKHRIVCIHCFSNDNGRHSRLFADLLTVALGAPLFTWGTQTDMPDVRERYFEALRKADRGDIAPLIRFARS